MSNKLQEGEGAAAATAGDSPSASASTLRPGVLQEQAQEQEQEQEKNQQILQQRGEEEEEDAEEEEESLTSALARIRQLAETGKGDYAYTTMKGGIPGMGPPYTYTSEPSHDTVDSNDTSYNFCHTFSSVLKMMNISINLKFIEDVYPWVVTLFIAMAVGTIEFAPTAILDAVLPAKLQFLDGVLDKYGLAAFVFSNIGICLGCATLATAVTVLFTPAAGGSGIPAILAYLTSDVLNDQELFAPLTILVKMLGICTVIGGGLVVGREVCIHVSFSVSLCVFVSLSI